MHFNRLVRESQSRLRSAISSGRFICVARCWRSLSHCVHATIQPELLVILLVVLADVHFTMTRLLSPALCILTSALLNHLQCAHIPLSSFPMLWRHNCNFTFLYSTAQLMHSPASPGQTATADELIQSSKVITQAVAKLQHAGRSKKREDAVVAADVASRSVVEVLTACRAASASAETPEAQRHCLSAGQQCGEAFVAMLRHIIDVSLTVVACCSSSLLIPVVCRGLPENRWYLDLHLNRLKCIMLHHSLCTSCCIRVQLFFLFLSVTTGLSFCL